MKWSTSIVLSFLSLTSAVSAFSLPHSPAKIKRNDGSGSGSPSHAVNLVQDFEHNRFADHFEVLSSDSNEYSMRIKDVAPESLGIDKVKQWSGYLDNDKKHWFYWFFESRNDPQNDPVILWLTGGPGCSSLIGLFFEIGPASIDNNLKPVHNPYSWNNKASVIFLEQPIGVGFSYGEGNVDTSELAAVDVVQFLELFFKKFPNLAKNKFHIAGDSYAGLYIPHITHEILKRSQGNGKSSLGFSLSSVLIGNGVTDPLVQYDYYQPMACGQGGYPAVLDDAACKKMTTDSNQCRELNKVCYSTGANDACAKAASFCDDMALTPYNKLGLNVFDIRGKCDHPDSPLCYNELFNVEKYMNQAFVQEALGSAVKEYYDCSRDINAKFTMTGDGNKPSSQYVAELLDQGIPVLIYAGDKDYLCHWLGNKAWTDALKWKHADNYKNLPLKPWVNKETGEKAGEVKSFDALTFLRLADAGHLAPHDQPKNSLYMVNNWLSGNHHLDY